ncbi:fungal-specific transcription factor domain-containing protein [Xylariales sp. PMI_506]|nr:fungal-specific transcription factor domain-containing protein [Xylariales sp. PMI_506]
MGSAVKKAKTKTFTGCWTCRSRKVKCDLGRPSCTRCSKARLECQGYNIPLHWVTDEEEGALSGIKRQAMSLALGNPHWPRGTLSDIDDHLLEVEKYCKSLETTTRISGPFGVFQSQWEVGENWSPSPASPASDSLTPVNDNARERSDEEIFQTSHNDPYVEEVNRSRSSFPDTRGVRSGSPKSSALVVGRYQPQRFRPDTQTTSDDTYIIMPWNTLGRNIDREHLITNLMEHYRHGVASILQPVRHSHNAYRSIYATEAMAMSEASANMYALQSAGPAISRVALLYSLLASAGFHLRGQDKAQDLDDMARYFRAKAYSHLQLALESLPVTHNQSSLEVRARPLSIWEGVLSVILTMVTADILDGSMSEFWIHLEATKNLVENLRSHAVLSSPAEHLINTSLFLRILSDSTDVNIKPVPWSPEQDRENIFLGGGHTLEFTYGITAKLANFIRRACLLAQNVAWYKENSCSQPEDFSSSCDELLNAISSWHISEEPLTTFSRTDDVTILLASKHMQAFAASIRIYFHARVIPCDSTTMQSLVQTAASHLTEIEEIKERTGYNAVRTASISWPGFIASCQADEASRTVWTQWWTSMLEYNIGNIHNLWSVVREAWALRDEELEDEPAWAAVLKRQGRRILAI